MFARSILLCLALGSIGCASTSESNVVGDSDLLSSIDYQVPQDFVVFSGHPELGLMVFYHDRFENGIFLMALPAGADWEAAFRQVLPVISASALPGKPVPHRWFATNSVPTSEFETSHSRRHGYNGESLLNVQIRLLEHEERRLLTGYYWPHRVGGGELTPHYERVTRGFHNFRAGDGLAQLINSITGEEVSEIHVPSGAPVFHLPSRGS